MADFNPQFATQTPSYLGLSKPISQPYAPQEGDKSTGMTLKAVGEGLDEGVALADSTIKGVIKDDLETKIRARRDQFNAQLDDLLGGKQPNPNMDLMPDQGTSPPTGVQQGLSAIQRLQNARDQGGKFRTTAMDADIDRILKQTRAQYPGYRDYIDQVSSSILGYNVANKLVSDKLAQINELSKGAKDEQSRVETFIRSHSDITGMPQIMANFQAGRITTDDVYRWASEADVAKAKLQNIKLGWEAQKAGNEQAQDYAGKYGEAVVDHFVNDSYRNNRLTNGQDPLKTGSEVHDTLVKIGSGEIPYPGDEQMALLQNQYEAGRADATAKIHAIIFTPNPKTGRSVADDWGVDNANNFIKKSVDAAYGTTSQLFSKKDFALAESNARRVAAATTDENMRLINSNMGQEALLSKAVSQDPAMSAVVSNKILTADGFMGKLNNFIDTKVRRAATGFSPLGVAPSLKQDISDTARTNGTVSEKAVAVKTFADVYKIITDNKASDASKLYAAKYLFDQNNQGFLQQIAKEGVGSDGMPTKGQIDVFEQVTNPKLSEEMYKLSQRTGKKDVWNNYTKLAQHEFGVKMITDIQNLNNLQDKSSVYGSQWHYSYNDESKQFEALHYDGTPLERREQTWLNPAYRTIDNINRGLENIRHMAEVQHAPADAVDAYVFQTLESAGWSPKKDVNGVPARLMNAILSSKGLPPTAKDPFPKDVNPPTSK